MTGPADNKSDTQGPRQSQRGTPAAPAVQLGVRFGRGHARGEEQLSDSSAANLAHEVGGLGCLVIGLTAIEHGFASLRGWGHSPA
ncbi:MAG TPA: hypothetical protein VF331_16015 [Polyangiales bacterium]